MLNRVVKEWVPNEDRLVRSAIADERYCQHILVAIHGECCEWSLEELVQFWADAGASDDTVAEWIRRYSE